MVNAQNVDVITIEYPPFTTVNSPHGGFLFELLDKITSRGKEQWVPFFVPPGRAAQLIESNNWCASFFPVASKDMPFEQYKLSDELVQLGLFRIHQEGEFRWNNLAELKGKSISLLRTSEQSPFVQQFIVAGLKVVFVENVETALKMLLMQRVDFAFGDSDLAQRIRFKEDEKQSLQFSKSLLLEVQLSIFINPACHLKLPESLLIKKQ